MSSQSDEDAATALNGALQVEQTIEQDMIDQDMIDQDMARLTQLLAQEPPLDEHADLDFQALLRQLETADGLAGDVESRIESVIGRLDEMLESLVQNAAEAGSEQVEALAVEVENVAVQVEVTSQGEGTQQGSS